jgi:hypothetical protein
MEDGKKYVDTMFLKDVESSNIPWCTNFLNARIFFETTMEGQEKEGNVEKIEEEWSSYPYSSPNNGNEKFPMETPSYIIACNDDIYSNEPILDEYFDVNAFYGESYDSWVDNIFSKHKNDSISTSPSIKNEDEQYCFNLLNDSAMDDASLSPGSPLCGTITTNIWEDESDLVELDDPLYSLDDSYLCGESIHNYDVEFTFNACNIMKEEEIRALFMLPCYLKCELLIIICIGYHKVAATCSCIRCQCIGRKLDLKVNGLVFCRVIHMLSNNIQFEHTFVSFVGCKICLATVFQQLF